MGILEQYLTAFGLSAAAGTRASVPVLALGSFHYTPWFELSREWAWIAHPAVMGLLTVLLALEFYAESHPDLSALNRFAGYAPALFSGFIAFASVTGTVDESLQSLAASGALGGITALVVRHARNRFHRAVEPFQCAGREAHFGRRNRRVGRHQFCCSDCPFRGRCVDAGFRGRSTGPGSHVRRPLDMRQDFRRAAMRHEQRRAGASVPVMWRAAVMTPEGRASCAFWRWMTVQDPLLRQSRSSTTITARSSRVLCCTCWQDALRLLSSKSSVSIPRSPMHVLSRGITRRVA